MEKRLVYEIPAQDDYRLEYANDYYIVLAPGDMTKSEDYDYNWYIVGE